MFTSRHIAALFLCTAAFPLRAENPTSSPSVSPAVIQSAEEKYSSEVAKAEAIVAKAEAELAKARKVAGEARLKAYRERLTDVTKSGDFDKAIAVKARIEQLEKEPESEPAKGGKRPRPKDTVKFGGHTYALIKEPATWHVAKQRCEEMGGHLVILGSVKEESFLLEAMQKYSLPNAWIGATDEIAEGTWKWVDGTDATFTGPHVGNSNGSEHYMEISPSLGYNDAGSTRTPYICEWDK